MKMNLEALQEKDAWAKLNVALPKYDAAAMTERTKNEPCWVHFGAGNIFRGFVASLQQQLLNDGTFDRGITAVETLDSDIIDSVFQPYGNLTMNVILRADGNMDCEILASIAEALSFQASKNRLAEVFSQPSLQMVSYTITEKGYALRAPDGKLLPAAEDDMKNGIENPTHVMGITAAMLYKRWQAGGFPISLVSMDNCSANGDILCAAVTEIAQGWVENGYAEAAFLEYLRDGSKVAFPWSMIDKITPRPAQSVVDMLAQKGIEGMEPFITSKQQYVAPFVNAERPQYLIIEDKFPNGRPPLEKAGVIFTDRGTVSKTERMKVTTCLNPLHTAMAVYGCLLGFALISEEAKDEDIKALIMRLGYTEGLPVVTDPGIISPRSFIDEVVNERLPNPFMPDAPQRIATDTSQKVGVRFGETIKSYIEQNRDLETLVAIPLAIAGWMRYLLAVDDMGEKMELSPDPLLDTLTEALASVVWNEPESYSNQLFAILSNKSIFGSDLTKTPLAKRIEDYFVAMLGGAGAVRETLRRELDGLE